MKITGVTIHPIAAPFRGSACCLLKLLTDSGLAGQALINTDVANTARSLSTEILVGADPRATVGLYERIGRSFSDAGTTGARARAALDIAAWDLKAQAADEPLWKTLGGSRPRAVAHASWTGDVSAEPQAMARWFASLRARCGLRYGSLPASHKLDADRQRLAAVRQALGATVPASGLMLDFGGRWPADDAIAHCRRLETEFDLTWARSPAPADDVEGSKRVADAIGAAVLNGGELAHRAAFLPWFEHYAMNVVELDIQLLGVTGILQLADAAFGLELPVVLSAAPGNIHVHLAPALASLMSVEVIDQGQMETLIDSDVQFTDGRGIAGDRPGTGLRFSGQEAER